MERTFFFGVLPSILRADGGASMRTRFCENYFSGDFDFRKTETNFVYGFCPRGGNAGTGFLDFLTGGVLKSRNLVGVTQLRENSHFLLFSTRICWIRMFLIIHKTSCNWSKISHCWSNIIIFLILDQSLFS